MATGTDASDSFEQVDWDEIDRARGTFSLSRRAVAQVVTYTVILAGFLYDNQILNNERPTIDWLWAVRYGEVGPRTQVVTQIANFRIVEATWDFTSVDWLFLLTLAILAFNAIMPLYDNPRLTRYYWNQFKRNRAAVVSLVGLVVLLLIGTFGPVFMAPPELNFTAQSQPPVGFTAAPNGQEVTGTWAHPLGTDTQGRDLVKLIVYGIRISMEIGLISMLVATVIGTVVGATSAHMGGMVDEVLMRYVDIQSVFPAFVLLLLIIYAWSPGLWVIIALFGFFSWEGTARLIRSEALQRTEEPYIQASEAAGASQAWIIRRHIIPNVSSTVITTTSLLIPSFILGAAGLAFLGLFPDGVFSLGRTISSGRGSLDSAPWISTIPGVFLFCIVLAFNYVGDAARDAFDPRDDQQ